MPKRIQRKRTKGWRMPDGAVYAGRPTKWGNKFTVGQPVQEAVSAAFVIASGAPVSPDDWHNNRPVTAEQAVAFYRHSLRLSVKHGLHDLDDLRGKDLACWCPLDQPCHADVLLELANEVVQ